MWCLGNSPDEDLAANDVWCFGNIVIELLIAHVIQCHPREWQSTLTVSSPEPAIMPGPHGPQFALSPNRSNRKSNPLLTAAPDAVEFGLQFDQIRDWTELIQWFDVRGFQLLESSHLLSQCRHPGRKQRLQAADVYQICCEELN